MILYGVYDPKVCVTEGNHHAFGITCIRKTGVCIIYHIFDCLI